MSRSSDDRRGSEATPEGVKSVRVKMNVIKRDGTKVPAVFDAITERNKLLCAAVYGGKSLDYILSGNKLRDITDQVVERFKDGISTIELDELTIKVCISMSTYHPDYTYLAARIMVSNLQKATSDTMAELVESMTTYKGANGKPNCQLSEEFVCVVKRASVQINRRIQHVRDYKFTYFGIQTMQTSYLLHNIDWETSGHGKITIPVERPQYTYMRVALGIWVCQPDGTGHLADEKTFQKRLENAFVYYDLLTTLKITHASPTMFNAGTSKAQLSSCFLLNTDDSISSIYDVSKDMANMSKYAGGIGLNLSHIRAYGSIIGSSGSIASGVTYPLMNKYNGDKNYTMREGGKRNGAYSTYLPIWHADFVEFIRLPRHTGNSHQVKDIKLAAWVSDLFMKITKKELAGEDVTWYQFSPDNADILSTTFGTEFEENYWRLVSEKKYTKTTKPSTIWIEIFKTIAQRGYPYIVFKDHINNRSNLSHDMTIETSNLCAEITIPCSTTSYGTCNLGCVALASYVIPDETADNAGKVRMDWKSMISAVRTLTRGLGKVMEISYTPAPQCKVSNNRYRPIGIGIMGLADVFAMFKLAWDDIKSYELDQTIQATIYYAAMYESVRMGKEYSNFEAFEGSAANRGFLQPDMSVRDGYLDADWAKRIETQTNGAITTEMWDELREAAKTHLYNGYVTANMPTATSSQNCGQNECFEPFTHNIYPRITIAGETIIMNNYLLRELEEIGMWSNEMRVNIIQNNGSIRDITSIPIDIRNRYRTARELDQRIIIKHAAMRAPFISQSQSMNLYMNKVTLKEFMTYMVYGWDNGVTTGVYYTHTGAIDTGIKSIMVASSNIIEDAPDYLKTIKLSDTYTHVDDLVEKNEKPVWRPITFDLDPSEVCTSCSV